VGFGRKSLSVKRHSNNHGVAIMEENAVMYECGHIEAVKDIEVNDMIIFDPTLRLPGKCHTCRTLEKKAAKALLFPSININKYTAESSTKR